MFMVCNVCCHEVTKASRFKYTKWLLLCSAPLKCGLFVDYTTELTAFILSPIIKISSHAIMAQAIVIYSGTFVKQPPRGVALFGCLREVAAQWRYPLTGDFEKSGELI